MGEVIYSRMNNTQAIVPMAQGSSRTHIQPAVVPRTLCLDCWGNITFCVRLRTNLNLNPHHVVRVLSEYLSSNRDTEGNIIAIPESRLSEHHTDDEIIVDTLFCFLDSFPLTVLFAVLDSQDLSQVSDAFCHHHYIGLVAAVPYSQFHRSRRLQGFFYTLKKFVDNDVINVENKFLKHFFSKKIRSVGNISGTDLELNTNKLALITWLRIQQCERNTWKIRKVLNVCLRNCPTYVDKTLVKAIYYSKMAVADAMDGDKFSALHHVHMANNFILLVNDPIKVLLYHDRRYVYQLLGQSDSMLNIATNRALAILDSCDEEENHCNFLTQMKRMFLLYAAEYYLGIGNDLKVNVRVVPEAEHAAAAKGTLQCFEESKLNDVEVEQRRLMIFYFCKGIFLESNDPDRAIRCLERALSYAQTGAKFGRERQNIETVLEQLQQRTK